MATFTAHYGFDRFLDDYVYQTDTFTISPTLVTALTPEGTIQHYRGSFIISGSEIIGGTLTGMAEYLADGTPWWNISNGFVPGNVYNSYVDLNDTSGLWAYALRNDDRMQGSDEADELYSFAGNDILLADSGNDQAHGGNGDDYVNGNEGSDTVYGNAGNDRASGGKGNDTVYGNAGNDLVNGNLGMDIVYGDEEFGFDSSSDTLRGGKDNDTVIGSSGNDSIYGDMGNDRLTGGFGTDSFVFASNSGQDTITDFEDYSGEKLHIQLNINSTEIADFADIDSRITETDSGISLDLGNGNSIFLENVYELDASHFVFFA